VEQGPPQRREQDEASAMRRAVELSLRGLGTTSPNPLVGAVVLDADGVVAGEGWHERAGDPHAEVLALRAAGDRARGGTAVLTLEPCDHTGRTPPCTRALREAGIARIVFAVVDPDPVAGGGAATLRAAGIEVAAGLLAAESERANEAWLTAIRTGRPHVTWKYAATLDGRVAAADGTSRWISSCESRVDAHRLRTEVDAILAGTGTVLTDDPHLTARTSDGTLAARQPLRVVIGERPLSATARVLDGAAETLLCRTHDVTEVLAALHERRVRSVLLEGGPTLAGAFATAGVVDRVVGYLAPALLGAGRPALGDAGITTLGAALLLQVDEVTRVGPDVRISARLRRKEP
jgi:diaminohydroxyphosphoribosylaminopyrimidine deaminase/5-amino-6-(5-phosphoribosylamino)uracil reductase